MPLSESDPDAIVIGSGPNGLAAAIELAKQGANVLVIEADDEVGGGTRSAKLTLPGFLHDVCSAVHPMGILSPYYRTLPLADHGLEWVIPPASVAHPLDDGDAIMMYHVRNDGITAYETMTGHRVKHVVAGFGEHIHFKVAKYTVPNKCDGEWTDGVLRWSCNAKLGVPRDPGPAHIQVPHH